MDFSSVQAEFRSKAIATVKANLVVTRQAEFLAAGGNQFLTFWTRDFCYSVPGLLLSGREELVHRQLGLFWEHRRKSDGLLPRGVDCVNPKLRVLAHTALPFGRRFLKYGRRPLKPEYLSEHGAPSIDSNSLVLAAAARWSEATGKPYPFPRAEVEAALNWYAPYRKGEWIDQPRFSDWQDSAGRRGAVLLTQLLDLEARVRVENVDAASVARVERKIEEDFFDSSSGLFREQLSERRFSLDSHALILTSDRLFRGLDRESLYGRLKASSLWASWMVPGVPVHPPYSAQDVAWTNRLVGLRGYHDAFHWGWLGAEAAKVAWSMGDKPEGDRIALAYWRASESDLYFSEIYEQVNGQLKPVTRFAYKSECPFTWSGAKWIEALAAR